VRLIRGRPAPPAVSAATANTAAPSSEGERAQVSGRAGRLGRVGLCPARWTRHWIPRWSAPLRGRGRFTGGRFHQHEVRTIARVPLCAPRNGAACRNDTRFADLGAVTLVADVTTGHGPRESGLRANPGHPISPIFPLYSSGVPPVCQRKCAGPRPCRGPAPGAAAAPRTGPPGGTGWTSCAQPRNVS